MVLEKGVKRKFDRRSEGVVELDGRFRCHGQKEKMEIVLYSFFFFLKVNLTLIYSNENESNSFIFCCFGSESEIF